MALRRLGALHSFTSAIRFGSAPPRPKPVIAGAADQARQIAVSGAAVVVAVSCDASSFARDARILADGGFALRSVKLIDQFLWSPQVELVAVFGR